MAVQQQLASPAESSAHAEQRDLTIEEVNPSVGPRSSNNSQSEETGQQQQQQQQQQPQQQPQNPTVQPPPSAYAMSQQQQQQHPYVPYNGFNTINPGVVNTRVLPPFKKKWNLARLSLNGLSVLFTILVIAISLGGFINASYDNGYEVVFTLPIAGAGLLWEVAELITYFIRARHVKKQQQQQQTAQGQIIEGHPRGIHPVAHIVLRLAWWILGLIAVFSSVISVRSFVLSYRECDSHRGDRWGYSSYWCDDILASGGPGSAKYESVVNMIRAICAFWCLFVLCHFVLWVMACIDTARRNRTRRAAQIYYVPAPMGYYPTMVPPPGAAPVSGEQQQPIQHPPAVAMAEAGQSDAEKATRAPSTYYA